MKKVVIIIVAVIILLGVSGCESIPAAQDKLCSPARNAYSIAFAINAYNALNPSAPLDPDIKLEDAKVSIKTLEDLVERNSDVLELWPTGLSDEEEKAAWELIVYKDNRAELTPEAQQALQEGSKDESKEVKNTNAAMIATGINVYNTLHPIKMLPDNMTIAEAKNALKKNGLWQSLLTEVEVEAAWELIEIKDGLATVKDLR